jgi:CheY-like chemotaxis protein
VGGTIKMLERLVGEGVSLAWHPGDTLWPVRVDPSQLDQILANLVVNARDAVAGAGSVAIETRNVTLDADFCAPRPDARPGDHVVITVRDNGCGMSAETMAQLFEPFFTTKPAGMGTGLGLATVYGIARQNKGFITAISDVGAGSEFSVYLPRHTGRVSSADAAVTPTAGSGGRETILLVEDEPAILRLGTTMLERQGYHVIPAATPGEAIRLAREVAGDIDLLVTDVVMPEMNGRDLARNLLSLYPDLARLYMSGYTADVIAHHGVLDDGVHFLQKPFSGQDLAAKVREALDAEQA